MTGWGEDPPSRGPRVSKGTESFNSLPRAQNDKEPGVAQIPNAEQRERTVWVERRVGTRPGRDSRKGLERVMGCRQEGTAQSI